MPSRTVLVLLTVALLVWAAALLRKMPEDGFYLLWALVELTVACIVLIAWLVVILFWARAGIRKARRQREQRLAEEQQHRQRWQ